MICVLGNAPLKGKLPQNILNNRKDSLSDLVVQIGDAILEPFGVLCRKSQQLMSSHTQALADTFRPFEKRPGEL